MMTRKRVEQDKVGYGNPPKHSRFQLGKSGNPKGRPKKRLTIEDQINAELNRVIEVTEHGRKTRMTVFQVSLRHIGNAAANGDRKALEFLLRMKSLFRGDPAEQIDINRIEPADRKLLDEFLLKVSEGWVELPEGIVLGGEK